MAPAVFDNPKNYIASTQWQIKIFDGEPDYETPHITVIRKQKKAKPKCWRINLRTFEIMDTSPPKKELPKVFVTEIINNYEAICKTWNQMYPSNPLDCSSKDKE